VARQVPEARCLTAIFIQLNGFQAICGNALRRVSDWHANCFEEVRKEQPNENQDQREGWYHRRPNQPLTTAAKSESVANGANGSPIQKGKEQDNENQDEFEGWFWRGQTDREHKLFVRQSGVLTSAGRRGFREEETMKTKTNVKAGIPPDPC
jgi:hypothetical protein